MTTRIIINQAASNTAKQGAQAVRKMLDALAIFREHKGVIDDATSGSDWAALAVELGLTGPTAATDAQNYWTIFSTAKAAIDVSAVLELYRIDQA